MNMSRSKHGWEGLADMEAATLDFVVEMNEAMLPSFNLIPTPDIQGRKKRTVPSERQILSLIERDHWLR